MSHLIRKLLPAVLVVLVILILGPIAVNNLSSMYFSSQSESPVLWQDEAASVPPALSAYEEGYFGYRCQAAVMNTCYGSTQVFIDALVLKLMPKEWLHSKAYQPLPGKKWSWLLEHPKMGVTLRSVRMVEALFLVFAVFLFALKLGVWPAAVITVGFTASTPFVSAWQGIKNDHMAALSILLFAVFLLKTVGERVEKKRHILSYFLLVVGAITSMVKPPCIVPVFIGFSTYALFEFIQRKSFRDYVTLLIRWAIVATFSLFVLNPNILISNFEAKWLFRFFAFATDPGRKPGLSDLIQEFRLAFLACMPAIIALGIAVKKKEYRLWLPIGFSILVIEYFFFRNSYNRPAYHLPSLVLSLVFFIIQAKDFKRSCLLLPTVAFMAFGINFDQSFTGHVVLERWKSLAREVTYSKHPSEDIGNKISEYLKRMPSSRFLVDINTRPAILRDDELSKRILWFDSLSQTPSEVSRLVRGLDGQAVIPCFAKETPSASDRFNPHVALWSAVSQHYCKEFENTGSMGFNKPFYNAFVVTKFAEVPLAEFKKNLGAALPIVSGGVIFPKHFSGTMDAFEFWGLYGNTSFYFDTSNVLHQEFIFDKAIRSLTFQFHSTCKSGGGVKVAVDVPGFHPQTMLSANIEEDFCRYYTPVCKQTGVKNWLERWSLHWFALPPANVEFATPVRRAKLKVVLDPVEEEGCGIIMEPVRVGYELE